MLKEDLTPEFTRQLYDVLFPMTVPKITIDGHDMINVQFNEVVKRFFLGYAKTTAGQQAYARDRAIVESVMNTTMATFSASEATEDIKKMSVEEKAEIVDRLTILEKLVEPDGATWWDLLGFSAAKTDDVQVTEQTEEQRATQLKTQKDVFVQVAIWMNDDIVKRKKEVADNADESTPKMAEIAALLKGDSYVSSSMNQLFTGPPSTWWKRMTAFGMLCLAVVVFLLNVYGIVQVLSTFIASVSHRPMFLFMYPNSRQRQWRYHTAGTIILMVIWVYTTYMRRTNGAIMVDWRLMRKIGSIFVQSLKR
jgi:hypothetical protein